MAREQQPADALGAVVAALSVERLSTYLQVCNGSRSAAVELYVWNARVGGAFWEALGLVEVALRNALDARLRIRHARLQRAGDWLDDPLGELHQHARADIATARRRLRRKGRESRHGQVIAELPFGFCRFLLAKQYASTLWPDLASAFPHAPNRSLHTVEDPVARLHEFRNRLAHHEPVDRYPLAERHGDLSTVVGYIDPVVGVWVAGRSRVFDVLAQRPNPSEGDG
jgi:hypothetical protein